MRLLRLALVNFRQHRETGIEFGPGLTGIIGPNGSGKSTLLEAIAWAIYGTDAARGTRESIRWRRARPRAEVKVELEFGLGPHEYRVVRTLYGAQLFLDGAPQPIVTSVTEVTTRLTRILGMTHAEFFNTYFTGQKELALMAAMRPTERGQFLSRLLGYDKLRLAQERLRARKSAMNAELVALRQGLPEPAELAEERERRARLLAEEDERLALAVEVLARAKAASDEHLPVFRGLDEFRERWTALTAERRLGEERVRQVVEQIGRLERERDEASRSSAERASQLAELERRAAVAREAAVRMKETAERLEAARAELEAVGRAYEERQATWVRERADADATRRSLVDHYRDLQAQKDRIVGAGPEGACPTCGRPLRGEFGAVLELLDGQLEAVMQNGLYYRSRLEQLKELPPDLVALDERRRLQADQVEQLAQDLAVAGRAAEEVLALERQRRLLAAEAERLPRLEAELREVAAERTRRVEALAATERDLAGLPYNEDAYQAAQQEMERLERAWQVAERDVAVAQAERRAAHDALREAERREHEAAARAARVAALETDVRLHGELDHALGDLRTELNQEMGPELAAISGELLADLTDGHYDEIQLDEAYRATVLEDGAPQPVISGGEEDLTNLVLRLGVSQMIADRSGHPLTLLVLDEIFGSLDEAHRTNVVRLLRRLEGRFPQVVLITHVESARESLDRVLRVRYDEAAGASVVTEERGFAPPPGGVGADVAA